MSAVMLAFSTNEVTGEKKKKIKNPQSLSVQCDDIQGPLGCLFSENEQKSLNLFAFASMNMDIPPTQAKNLLFCHVKHTHMLSIGHLGQST